MTIDQELRARADRVVPGGMWGHLAAARQPPGYPQFFARASGGQRFRDGLEAQSIRCGLPIVQSGPPQLPLVRFRDDPGFALGKAFCREALRRGVYLHHNHTMFLSVAHTEADIDEALEATAGAFEAVADRVPVR